MVKFAAKLPGETVLDVGTGTRGVAITSARTGARVTGLDLSPSYSIRPHVVRAWFTSRILPPLKGSGSRGDRFRKRRECHPLKLDILSAH